MRKILHAADIHLDSPLRNLSQREDAPAEQIRKACRIALENMVQLAIDQSVDLVVIAGDLYDGNWKHQKTGLFFVRQARRLIDAGIPLVVIRGNHDAQSKITTNLRLPANPDGSAVMLGEGKVQSRDYDLGDVVIAVHGRSYTKQHERSDLVKKYPPARSGAFNLGILHTSLTGFDGHQPYAPCTPAQLADFDYDYWALGHIHARGEHQIEGAAPVVFSGNIQGRKINEPGAKGCYILEIDANGLQRKTFYPLDVLRFECCSIDVSGMQHVDEIYGYFENWLTQKLAELQDRMLIPRVVLNGSTDLYSKINRRTQDVFASLHSVALDHGEQVWIEKIKLKTMPPPSGTGGQDSTAQSDAASSIAWVIEHYTTPTPKTLPSSGELFHLREDTAEEDTAEENAEENRADARQWIQEELRLLLQKLPKEMSGEDAVIDLEDGEEVHRWIQHGSEELLGRLMETEAR